MTTWNPRANELFLKALELRSADERQKYLDAACPGDSSLRAEVESLLEASARAGGFLESPALDPWVTVNVPISERPGTVIGPYKLLEQIGEGGFGVVFMAEQTKPVRRKVALKVIKPGMDTRQVVARFEAERQALALMDHPNIAHVFDGGTTDVAEPDASARVACSLARASGSARPYFVMELVRGVPITDFCDQNHLRVRERLELFASVCLAVQHAHHKGIIHRDIKPTNILVTLHDDKAVAKVIDFGIAKATGQQLTQKTLFTNFTQMVGTPLYMSPEQAQMSGLDVDTRSDIYSLGVLLYELLTGATPLDRDRLKTVGFDEIRRIISEEEPAKPSTRISTLGQAAVTASANRQSDPKRLKQLIRGELDWIVMKALEKDRNRRYETASAFAADVQRYLNDEQVQACPPSSWYRFRKFARRNKRALATAALLGVMLLAAVGAVVASALWAADQAKARQAVEAAAKKELEQTLYFTNIALAERELSANNLGRALRLLDECPEVLREWEWHYLMRLCRVEPLVLRDKTEVNSLAFSPDGECLASAGADGTVKVWNSKTGQVIQTIEKAHRGFVCSVAFHPDGRHLASVGADKRVKVWDSTTRLPPVFEGPCDAAHVFGTAYAAAFNPRDGRQLAAGSDGAVKVWDWRNRQILQTLHLSGPDMQRISLAFSRDGRRLASGNWRGSVNLWDPAAGGEPLCTFPESREARHPVSALAFSKESERLATASFGRRVDVWDTTTGELLLPLPHKGAIVLGVAFSRDGKRLASASEDKTVRIWDATTGREVLRLRGHTGVCGCVTFSPDGQRLASASKDRTIRVWDATPHAGQEFLTFTQHSNEIWGLAVSPDGQKVVSAGWGMPAKVWDTKTGQGSVEFPGHRGIVFCVAWKPDGPDGQRIASAGMDDGLFTVKVWDPQSGREDFTLPAAPEEYFAVAFSPDGRYLVTGGKDGTIRVWDARTGKKVKVGTLGTHDRPIRGVVFSPDGRHLASASDDGLVKLWDATRLDEKQDARRTLRALVPGQSLNVAFSPNGRRLATSGEENTVKIWDVQTGDELLPPLRGHTGDVYTVAFSPDPGGRWIASAGEDSIVRVWDSQTRELVRSFRGHTGLVSSLAFSLSPDGRRFLVSGSRDHKVKVWDVTQLSDEVPER